MKQSEITYKMEASHHAITEYHLYQLHRIVLMSCSTQTKPNRCSKTFKKLMLNTKIGVEILVSIFGIYSNRGIRNFFHLLMALLKDVGE